MATVKVDTPRVSHLVKHEHWPETGFCRLAVTVNEASAKTYQVGTVLGKVTADGKYKIAVQTAVDGSQTAAAIVLDDYSIAATTDTKVLVLVKGPAEVSKGALVLDATYDLDAEKAVVYASLEALNINVLTTN
jgi:predicted aspartyl protease